MRSAIVSALRRHGFEQARSCLYLRSDELVWVVWPKKGRSIPWFCIDVGLLSRELSPDMEYPTYHECHFLTDYAFIGARVPDAAAGSRYRDHRSYFTRVLTLDDDRIDDDERREAIEFAAADLSAIASSVSTLKSFGPWRTTEAPDSYLHTDLRRLLLAAQ